LSTAQFINLKEAAANLEVGDAVSALSRAQ